MKRILALISLSIIGLYSHGAFADSSQKFLDLNEFVRAARANDVGIEKVLHERVQTTFLRSLSLPSPGVLLQIENQYGFSLDEGERTTVLDLAASKEITTTGTTLTASHSLNRQEDREEDQTRVALEQSLFRNAFGKQTRRQDQKLIKENEAILLRTVEAYEDYIATLISGYFDWQLSHVNRTVAQELLSESQSLQHFIEERSQRHIASKVDVGRVALESMGYEEAILELDISLVKQGAEIASAMGKEVLNDLQPSALLDWTNLKLDFEQTRTAALSKGRMLGAYALAEEAGALEIQLRKEDLDPAINLIGGFRYDDSTRFTVSTDRKEVYVGFNAELPLWDQKSGAEVKKAAYEKMSATLAKKEYLKNLSSALRAQEGRIQTQRKRIELSEKKWTVSKDVARRERKRYENGKIDLETLISARQAQANSRFEFLKNRIQLNKDIVEWLRLTDQLIVKDEPNLPAVRS